MITAAPSTFRARLSPDRRKIIITGRTSPELNEFFHSLPNAKWDAIKFAWTCDFSPAAAWRVAGRVDCQPCAELLEAANEYRERLLTATNGMAISAGLQPRVRKADSWKHQVAAYHFAYPLPGALLAKDMGTGKSKDAVDLIQNWGCRSVLILCPTSVRAVWRREFDRWAAVNYSVCVLEKGTVKDKQHAAEGCMRLTHSLNQPCAIVVNYESAWRAPFAAWALAHEWDCVVLDEIHRCKSPTTAVGKFVAKLGCRAARRLGLSGTPLAHSPLDAFGVFRFLEPALFGTSWFHFRARYAEMRNPTIPQQVTGYKNLDELHDRMALITYQCKAKDVLDLPPVTHTDLPCSMEAKAARVYRDLEEEFIAEVEGGVVTVANALVKMLRLAQVTSGYVQPDDGAALVEVGTHKEDVLADLMEDLGNEPLVVFCRFRHDLEVVRRRAEAAGRRYAELSGSRRDALDDRACLAAGVEVAGVQIASGGVGVDFTRARYGVYYSLTLSLAEFDQSQARLHRPGQTRNTCFFHLVSPGSVDQRIYRALEQRREVIESVLRGYANESEDGNAHG